jgi:outer membrane protein
MPRLWMLIAAALTLTATVGARTALAVEKPLIGYVNLQRAILEVEEGKRAKANLKKTFEKKQTDLSKRENELKNLKDAIERESMVKDDAATRQRKVDFQNKLLELQQVFVKEQQELQAAEQKELAAITEKMRAVIAELGKTGGYTIILEVQDSRLLFAKPSLDLTNEIIRKYNGKYR